MKPIQEKFCKALKSWFDNQKNLDVNGLAEMLKGSQGYISNVLNNRRCGDEQWRRNVAQKIGLPYEYMIGIEGKPTTPDAPDPIIITATSDRDKAHLTEHAANYRSVPLYTSGRLAAWSNGSAFDQYEAPTSDVLVYTPELGHRAKHNLTAARVGGDSMEPLVPMNSIIIVDMDDKEFVDNKVFAVAIDEGGVKTLAVKRVRKFEKAKGFVLWSENQEYQPVLVVESDWLRLCVGRVVWMWRSFEG